VSESETGPLVGRTVVVTRAAEQAEPLCRALEGRGARAIAFPLIEFAPPEDSGPLDEALRGIAKFRWLFFTSQNAVRALAERSLELGISLEQATRDVRIAAVGPATAAAARKAGLQVAYTALKHQGTSLASELSGELPGWRMLLPRSDRANPVLPEMLRRMGAEVTEVEAYRTMDVPDSKEAPTRIPELFNGALDSIVFFSPSAVDGFVKRERGAEILRAAASSGHAAILAIGEVTAEALRKVGVEQCVQAKDTTVEGVVRALEEFFAALPRMRAQENERR
jgi:uroporphyrinogen III methyltransferase / synthase